MNLNTATPRELGFARPGIDQPGHFAWSTCFHCGERITAVDITADWMHAATQQVTCENDRQIRAHWNRQFEDA